MIALAPVGVLAQGFKLAPDCNPTLPPNSTTGNPCNIAAFIAFLKKIIQFMFVIAIPLAVIVIVWGAFVIMTAGGSESRVTQGKGIITAAVIGLAILLGSWLIVTTVLGFLKGF